MTRFSSLRTRLLLLVLLAVLPALGLMLYTGLEQRRVKKMEAQEDALRMIRLIANEQERLIEGTRQILFTLTRLPVVRDNDLASCSPFFTDLLGRYPYYVNLGVAKPDGDVFCSGMHLTQPVNVSQRAWFQRTMQTHNFSIGDYQTDPITNKGVIVFSYPILKPAGQIQSVVFLTLDLVWLNQLATEMQLPPRTTLTMTDRNGTILVRYPNAEGWVGRLIPEASIIKTMLTQQREGTVEALGLAGAPRLHAFTPLRGTPEGGVDAYISIGIPTAVIFADANQVLARNLGGLGLVAMLALMAAWAGGDLFILRRVRALLRATKRLSAGDLSARTDLTYGSDELSQLAHAFDEMAEALQTRQAEVKRAEEEIRTLNAELEQRVIERTAQLAAANKELEAFSYSVSHDLRAPLRAMHGFSRILLEKYAPQLPSEAERYLHIVQDNAQQMGQLIDDLLAFSRLSRQSIQKQPVALADLVRRVLEDLRYEQEDRCMEIAIGDLPICQGDPALLKQVFINLLANALKFTRQQEVARIEVGCQQREGECVYFVKDNGVGFDMQYAHKLFGVFQRLHRAEEYEGTGVGLAIVQRVLLRHGGRIWAEAEVNKGATFYFTI